jgi:hypothetical protein
MLFCDRVREVVSRSIKRATTSVTSALLYCPNRVTAGRVRAMRSSGGSRGMAPLTLNFGTAWRRVVNLTPRLAFPCGKKSAAQRIGGRVGLKTVCRRGNLLPLLGVEPLIAQPTAQSELCRLLLVL